MRFRIFPFPFERKLNKSSQRLRYKRSAVFREAPKTFFSARTQAHTQHHGPMKQMIQRITLPLLAIALASCASQSSDPYDTAPDYGQADAGVQDPNPVYDTPAAYEEGGNVATAPPYGDVAEAPAEAPAVAETRTAIIHTVVKGDTLSGLSSKYNVPAASIKQANQMTTDIVVLGRKMVIPPR